MWKCPRTQAWPRGTTRRSEELDAPEWSSSLVPPCVTGATTFASPLLLADVRAGGLILTLMVAPALTFLSLGPRCLRMWTCKADETQQSAETQGGAGLAISR